MFCFALLCGFWIELGLLGIGGGGQGRLGVWDTCFVFKRLGFIGFLVWG